MDALRVEVARVARDTWRAVDGDAAVGTVKAVVRPDERCFVFFHSCRNDAYAPLVRAIAEDLGRDVYVTVDEADAEARGRYEQLGFFVIRCESEYLVPTAAETTGVHAGDVPAGFVFLRADEVDVDRLRVLDDALRQDVPGTDGWQWRDADFREETFNPAYFDPSTYLVAVERTSGEYAGLVRVWKKPTRPRLGMIAVLPEHRRRGLAKALLAQTFAVLDERGESTVSTEIDDTNAPSIALLSRFGARRTGATLELVRESKRTS